MQKQKQMRPPDRSPERTVASHIVDLDFVKHLRRLWGRYWLLPFVPLAFLPVSAAFGQMRIEIVVVVLVLVALGVASTQTRSFVLLAVPGIAVALGYEIVRYLRPLYLKPERVLGCDLRAVELAWFPAGNNLTWPDYFAIHNAPFWDAFFAIPYTVFWAVAVIWGAVLFFLDRPGMVRFLWTLAGVHAVAFVIWLVFPAAPPWYIQLHGCAIDIGAAPSPAALARLDELFNIDYFADFYSRAPTVFGALPSLHCSFPAAALVASWRTSPAWQRALHAAYLAWMLAASVYLNHHWLLDGLTSVAIVFLLYALIERLLPRSGRASTRIETKENA
ncbi:MAG: phosphatase PAP2 family protein [Alphaproteobacteria bacterium]|nr:phosphatase PAP2 family protein [Alphaproteobacteria bacterium]